MTAARSSSATVDVAVVGAGFAGLSATEALIDAGLDVEVFEARPRVGGRTHTIDLDGVALDLGGQWIGPGQNRIASLVDRLGFETYPQYDTGDVVVVRDGTVLRVGDAALAFADDELVGYLELVGELETIARTIPVEAPWSAANADRLDTETLATWLRGRESRSAVAALFEVAVEAVFAAGARDMSLLHVAHYVAAAGGWAPLTDTAGGAQERRVVGGLQPVAEALARPFLDRVHLHTPVVAINRAGDGYVVEARQSDGHQLRTACRAVVVAVPPSVSTSIAFDPPLPGARDQLVAHMPGGSVIKFHAVFDRPFWRDDGLSGQVIDPNASVGTTFDGTPPDEDAPGVITGFFEAGHATAAGRLDTAARRALVVDHLRRTLGPAAEQLRAYRDLDWATEPATRGCYGAHLPPGAWTRWGPELRRPVGGIHWAGTECATRWVGYIDGAIESGRATAGDVIDHLGSTDV